MITHFATGSEFRCVKKRVAVARPGYGAMVADVPKVAVTEKPTEVPRQERL